jgi:aspartyl-tRNA(Asn)/glutamyl-tRNA(Gln) amidotransferase subunit A
MRRLGAAGAVLLGKLNMDEFAMGSSTENSAYRITRNPWDPERIPGGSSGGSAVALATGAAALALGTDTGGSIRIPAACCGVAGLKPTWGLVPLDGCFPLAPSLDHGGPMASSVEGCTAMLEALVPEFERSSLGSLADIRVGVAWTEHAEPLVRARVEEAAAAFPDRRTVDPPLGEAVRTVFMREVADVHRELYAENADLYGANVAAKIELCLAVTDSEYEAGLRARDAYRDQMAELFDQVDLMVTPTLPLVAPRAGQDERELRGRLTLLTWPFNVLGAPALALPCGPAEDGLPASVQIAGPPGADALVLAAGALLEDALKP